MLRVRIPSLLPMFLIVYNYELTMFCTRGVIREPRKLEVLVSERTWEFESPRVHHQ